MALLWIEGFEGFGDTIGGAPEPTDSIANKYPIAIGSTTMDIEEGRGGSGYCLEINSYNHYLGSPDLTTDRTVVLGCAVNIHFTGSGRVLGLRSNDTVGIEVYQSSGNVFKIYVGGFYTGEITTKSFLLDTWYYLELKVYTDSSAGTIDLFVNGSNWLSVSGLDTQGVSSNNYVSSFQLRPATINGRVMYDDIYFLDSTGPINNDVLGPMKVVAIKPDGAGDDSDWTPSAGSNYENVDDGAVLDEDTTYNETSTDAHQDLFTYGNLPATVVTVKGVQTTTDTRISGGTMALSTVVKTGTTTDVGSPTNVISTEYGAITRVDEVDPDTGIAWTPSGVDGAQFGVVANTI